MTITGREKKVTLVCEKQQLMIFFLIFLSNEIHFQLLTIPPEIKPNLKTKKIFKKKKRNLLKTFRILILKSTREGPKQTQTQKWTKLIEQGLLQISQLLTPFLRQLPNVYLVITFTIIICFSKWHNLILLLF